MKEKNGSIIGTSVILRPITMQDTHLIVKWRNRDHVRQNFIFRETFTAEMHENWMNTRVASGEVVQYIIEEKMLPQAENEQWEEADANYVYIKKVWDSHHNFYLIFLDGSAITQIQQEMTRLESSLQGREPSGTVTSLKLLSEALDLLYKNELLTIENVF